MRYSAILSVAATLGCTAAQRPVLGFNSGASDDRGNPKNQEDFEREFRTAQNLNGAPGEFNTIRLYSNVQWQTQDTPIPAFGAAVETNTSLLLGIWTSGTNSIDNELNALEAALEEYGDRLADLVRGISVGSEDMYRSSEWGVRNEAGVGQEADTIVRFIRETRSRLANTSLRDKPITHVDSWSAWVNSSNRAVIDEVDFLGVNVFPFFHSGSNNQISNAATLLSSQLNVTDNAAGGKEVWITETGWPYTGPDFDAAEATVDNAGEYWREVGCKVFGRRNVFWYTLRDANPENKVKFAITDDLSTSPRFDLSCPADSGELPPPIPLSIEIPGSTSASPISKPFSTAMALSVLLAAAWAL